MNPRSVVMLILAILLLIVLAQNTQVVMLRFLIWKIQMSQIIFTSLMLGTGFVLGYIAARITGGESRISR